MVEKNDLYARMMLSLLCVHTCVCSTVHDNVIMTHLEGEMTQTKTFLTPGSSTVRATDDDLIVNN